MSASTQSTVVAESATGKKQPSRGKSKKVTVNGLPWILPAVIFVVGLIYYSIFYTFDISATKWDGLSPIIQYIGFDNYVQLFRDPIFWGAVWHTALFFVITFSLQTLLGFMFAAILHTKVYLATLHKIIIFIPTVLAPATMAPVFRLLFSPQGLLDAWLGKLGLGTYAPLANPSTALFVLMAVSVWEWTGLYFILFYAAMSQIEPEMLEAARIDGAGNIRTLLYIVWPNCRGTTISLAMLGFIGALKTFDIPYLITTGGPNHATEFLGTYIYRQGIRQAHVGYASALSVVLLVLAIGGAILMSRANRRD